MKKNIILLFVINAFAIFANAKTIEKNFYFSADAEIKAPIFIGAGIGVLAYDHFKFGLKYGITPEFFYKVIGDAAVEFGDKDSYDDVIESAFQNNGILQLNLQYNFSPIDVGWSMGLNTYSLISDGRAEIDKVLAASTGRDYNGLKNLLILAGKDTSVLMKSDLIISEIFITYKWELQNNFKFDFTFGLAKVMYADINLKTGLSTFEASPGGSQLMRDSEADLEDIVTKYGISPTVGSNLSYNF